MNATGQQHRRVTTATLLEEDSLLGSQIADLLGITTRSVNNRHHA